MTAVSAGRRSGRVVFFLRGRTVPSSRARGFFVAAGLRAAGVACDVRAAVPSVDGDSWLPWWCKPLGPVFIPVAAAGRLFSLGALAPGDTVVFQKFLTELPTVALERRLARRHPTIFDFDDAVHLIWHNRKRFRALVSTVDHVIAGNAVLAEAAAAPGKTTVIPTSIDTRRYAPLPPNDHRGKDVVIGWSGLGRNYPQLLVALEPLRRVIARTRARLLLISDRPPPSALARLGAEFVPWRRQSELDDLGRIDVGLMPLPDTPYARGKCAYKLLQYMALARPAVASPVGANREVVDHGRDGFLAPDDRGWEDALAALVDDPALRARVGAEARRRVEARYSLTAVLPDYLRVLGRVAGRADRGSA